MVFVSALVGWQTGVAIDGYVGAAVALFVIWSGFSIVREAVSPLLGQAPDPEMVRGIKELVLSHEGIVGVHDVMVHNYGPGRCVISLHAEVPCREDLMRSHDRIDCIEKELMQKYHAVACIHMDPVDTEDERVETLRLLVEAVLKDMDERLEMHDFRVVFGETHTNLIFALVVPYGYRLEHSVGQEAEQRLQRLDPKLFVVATVEHSYT